MTYFFIFLFYFIALLYLLVPVINATSTFCLSPQEALEHHYDIQYIATLIEKNQQLSIQEIDTSALHTNNHDNLATSATVKVCEKIGGKKMASACSYVVNARPWKTWKQKVSRSIYAWNSWYAPVAFNSVVKTIGYPSVDAIRAVQVMVDDWWTFPFLEWQILKTNLIGLWQHPYNSLVYWYLGTDMKLSMYGDDNDNDGDNNNNRCYYDLLGMKLCVEQDQLLDGNELDNKVYDLHFALEHQAPDYTFHQFQQWVSKAARMTSVTMERARALWSQHIQGIKEFSSKAQSINACRDNNNNIDLLLMDPEYDLWFRMDAPSPLLFAIPEFSSTSSLALSLILGNNQVSLSTTTTTPAHLPLPLIPIRQPSTTCPHNIVDAYNDIQQQYLVTRMQNEMMKLFERLEKAMIQQYLQIMAPISFDQLYYQQEHQQQQQLYPEIRLYIIMSLRQVYEKYIQQMIDQYDELGMEQGLQRSTFIFDAMNKHIDSIWVSARNRPLRFCPSPLPLRWCIFDDSYYHIILILFMMLCAILDNMSEEWLILQTILVLVILTIMMSVLFLSFTM